MSGLFIPTTGNIDEDEGTQTWICIRNHSASQLLSLSLFALKLRGGNIFATSQEALWKWRNCKCSPFWSYQTPKQMDLLHLFLTKLMKDAIFRSFNKYIYDLFAVYSYFSNKLSHSQALTCTEGPFGVCNSSRCADILAKNWLDEWFADIYGSIVARYMYKCCVPDKSSSQRWINSMVKTCTTGFLFKWFINRQVDWSNVSSA